MARLEVKEFSGLVRDAKTQLPQSIVAWPPLASYSLDTDGDQKSSDAFGDRTSVIEIKAVDGRFCFDIGTDPKPEGGKNTIEEGERVYYGVTPGMKIAVCGDVA